MLAGSVPFSSAMFTVPTVPACTSSRLNASGAIQCRTLAISSGVASSYFIEPFIGSNPITAIFGVDARATISGPSPDSATTTSPEAAAKISLESSCVFLVCRPAPSGVSGRQCSIFTALFVALTGIGDPEAGGAIHNESALGFAAGANRSSTTMSALAAASYFEVGFHLRIRCDQGAQPCRIVRINDHFQRLLRRQLDHGAIVLRELIVRRD